MTPANRTYKFFFTAKHRYKLILLTRVFVFVYQISRDKQPRTYKNSTKIMSLSIYIYTY